MTILVTVPVSGSIAPMLMHWKRIGEPMRVIVRPFALIRNALLAEDARMDRTLLSMDVLMLSLPTFLDSALRTMTAVSLSTAVYDVSTSLTVSW